MMRVRSLWFVVIFIVSCNQTETQPVDKVVSVVSNQNALKPISIDSIKVLSLTEALQSFAAPMSETEFQMDGGLSEFRIELYNLISAEVYNHQVFKVREVTWQFDPDNLVTVWYALDSGEWRYLHHLVWDEGAEF